MVVQSSIFTGYFTGKVHVGEISYKLSCGPVAEGFRRRTLASKFGTSPKSQHEDLRCSKYFRWNEGMQRRQESEKERVCREGMLNFRRSDRYNDPSLFTDLKQEEAVCTEFFVQRETSEGCVEQELCDQT